MKAGLGTWSVIAAVGLAAAAWVTVFTGELFDAGRFFSADTFERGLEVLRPRGMMVTFGNASGPVPPMPPLRLSTGGSLFLTRPTLGDHTATRAELEQRANDLFGWIADGRLDVRVGARFPMADARAAHEALQGRATTGKVLLIP